MNLSHKTFQSDLELVFYDRTLGLADVKPHPTLAWIKPKNSGTIDSEDLCSLAEEPWYGLSRCGCRKIFRRPQKELEPKGGNF